MPEESIKPTTTSNYSLVLGVNLINGAKIKVNFDGRSMKHEQNNFLS